MLHNFTPHQLVIYAADSKRVIAILPSEGNARAAEVVTPVGEVVFHDPDAGPGIAMIAVPAVEKQYRADFGDPTVKQVADLVADDEFVAVSLVTLQAMRAAGLDHANLVAPDTGPDSVVRDADGKILGVRRLQR